MPLRGQAEGNYLNMPCGEGPRVGRGHDSCWYVLKNREVTGLIEKLTSESDAVERGVFPSARSEDEEEERLGRLVLSFSTALPDINLAFFQTVIVRRVHACTRPLVPYPRDVADGCWRANAGGAVSVHRDGSERR